MRLHAQLAAAGWIAPFGGEITDFDPKALIQPRKSIKVMSRDIQARLGGRGAGLAGFLARRGDASTRNGSAWWAQRGRHVLRSRRAAVPFVEWIKAEDFDIHRWSRAAMGELYPLWMLKYLPNMPACHIGIRYDARGPNNTIAEGDVSSLLAVSEAADVIRRGHADVMIVGGTGSRINISDMMWHRGARLALQRQIADQPRFAGRSMRSAAGRYMAKARRKS